METGVERLRFIVPHTLILRETADLFGTAVNYSANRGETVAERAGEKVKYFTELKLKKIL